MNSAKISISFSLLLILSIAGCSSRHPTDQKLLAEFQSHKAQFEQLLAMFQADKKLERVAYSFTRPDNPVEIGITRERIQQYRDLFDNLKLTAGIEGLEPKDMVMFHRSTYGLSVSGSSKGFAYFLKPPQLLVDSLDGYRSKDGRSFTAFRHIEGNWYLYYDYED